MSNQKTTGQLYALDPNSEPPLKPEEFTELVEFFCANQVNLPRIQYSDLVAIFAQYGTRFSLPAMYRFLKWALLNGMEKGMIMATLGHDLNGSMRPDPFFAPRTETY